MAPVVAPDVGRVSRRTPALEQSDMFNFCSRGASSCTCSPMRMFHSFSPSCESTFLRRKVAPSLRSPGYKCHCGRTRAGGLPGKSPPGAPGHIFFKVEFIVPDGSCRPMSFGECLAVASHSITSVCVVGVLLRNVKGVKHLYISRGAGEFLWR